ncbi:winged helix family transcriptional regulator [Chitinophaga sancti]|uniref:Transcriptional regulatory protein, C terminal n=1 Tax=Chitinophaga sancti TaxID=1004 RepID=A0A1K1RAF6_9BACT|nr:winged helix-turn-helix domain-containing protein [Chitinophaga sancti]WQD65524.1 winged helix-turn-helix domain-containing protein [Chitinophaga sancti]WQG88853.1 winged helix-turn-helix domain-containing protein [Chitinophaga sancti]SFW68921.1 Transcriptional regulatory protein, C terminal [Chitinophaga sancti]
MRLSLHLLSGKGKYFPGFILFLGIALFWVAFSMEDSDFDISRREISLRRIGHELLLQSGDRTSRVLPVKKIAANEYQIGFEHDLTFQPEFLVNTTRRLLGNDPLIGDYVVTVLNRGKEDVVYGFAISGNKDNDIIACKGRVQPKADYLINVKFRPAGMAIAKNGFLLGGLPFLAFIGFILFRSVKPQRVAALPTEQPADVFTFGGVVFDAQKMQLTVNQEIIDLTDTEGRLLRIFASSPNEMIERSRLQKEIWEDEGVIVGRSLDMFISKLRKKLEMDPGSRIVVVRGKGYKLEISV